MRNSQFNTFVLVTFLSLTIPFSCLSQAAHFCVSDDQIGNYPRGTSITYGLSRVDQPPHHGWHVQYRRVTSIERIAFDPITKKSWYRLNLSKLIPSEDLAGHNPQYVQNGWLWVPDGHHLPGAKGQGPSVDGTFHVDHTHTNCSMANCPVLNQNISFEYTLQTLSNGEIEGRGTDTNSTYLKGSLNGTTFRYKYYTNSGQYLGIGIFYFASDFSAFSGTFHDQTNGHSGIISGSK